MTPQIEAFLEMMAVERDASPHTLSAYGRDLTDAEGALDGGLMKADAEAVDRRFHEKLVALAVHDERIQPFARVRGGMDGREVYGFA